LNEKQVMDELESNEEFKAIDIDWTQIGNPDYKNERLEKAANLLKSKVTELESKFMPHMMEMFSSYFLSENGTK